MKLTERVFWGMCLVAIARQASLIEHREPLETGKVLCEYSVDTIHCTRWYKLSVVSDY